MKRILVLLTICCAVVLASAQTHISVYISDTANLIGNYKSTLGNNLAKFVNKHQDYQAINRSSAVDDMLLEVRKRQQNGNVDFAQIISTTKEFGETQVLYVEVVEHQRDNMLEFNAQIIDAEKNIPLKSTAESLHKDRLSYENILEVAQNLLIGLDISADNSKSIVSIKKQKDAQINNQKENEDKVNQNAIIASTFIPGAGQFYKHDWGSGTGFLVSELALVSGGTACYFMKKKHERIFEDGYYVHDVVWVDSEEKAVNAFRISMIVCYSLAAAVHIGNMIHAWYAEDKNTNRQISINVVPVLIPTNDFLSPSLAMGACLQINF